MHRLLTSIFALALLAGCSPGSTGATTSVPDTTTSSVTPTTTPATTSTLPSTTTLPPEPPEATVTVLLRPYEAMGPEWAETVFPYGTDEQHLGTSPGGDGGLMWGPEYGAQVPDRSWWFFDAANLRLAHFNQDAGYLGQAPMPEDLLVSGIYFQYQMPIALDSGWVTGFGFRADDTTSILRLIDEELTEITVDSTIAWVNTDGTYLYGLSFEENTPNRLDPESGAIEEVEWLVARDGSQYGVTVDNANQEVIVELPDVGVSRTLQMRYSEDPEVGAFTSIEVETGVDGTLHFLFTGAPESDESLGIGGYLTIGPNGAVSELEPITEPFTPADPGTGGRLGITPGTNTPWIMIVGEDGVHVFIKG